MILTLKSHAVMTRLLFALVVILPFASAPAQEYQGIWMGLGAARTALTLDSAPTRSRWGTSIRAGFRVCAFCWANYRKLSATPGITLNFTDVRGMTRGKDPFAFSRLDFGVQVAWEVGSVRLYAMPLFMNGRTTEIERDTVTRGEPVDSSRIWPLNYIDENGKFTGAFGLEIPITPQGRGLDISVTPAVRGNFEKYEFRSIMTPTKLGYKGWVVTVAWSGPFRGGLPWQ